MYNGPKFLIALKRHKYFFIYLLFFTFGFECLLKNLFTI